MKNTTITFAIALMAVLFAFGCAEEGDEGSEAVDCGEHGSEHDGHCHCDDGYLWNGSTCVVPEEITEVCEEHEEEEEEEEHEHQHGACVCPDEGECHCDHGEIETYGDHDYCAPELHG
jgi:hypothetical protein